MCNALESRCNLRTLQKPAWQWHLRDLQKLTILAMQLSVFWKCEQGQRAKTVIGRASHMEYDFSAFRSSTAVFQLFGVGTTFTGYPDYDGDIKCPQGTNPIGFGARSSCYSITDFKVMVMLLSLSTYLDRSCFYCISGRGLARQSPSIGSEFFHVDDWECTRRGAPHHVLPL